MLCTQYTIHLVPAVVLGASAAYSSQKLQIWSLTVSQARSVDYATVSTQYNAHVAVVVWCQDFRLSSESLRIQSLTASQLVSVLLALLANLALARGIS